LVPVEIKTRSHHLGLEFDINAAKYKKISEKVGIFHRISGLYLFIVLFRRIANLWKMLLLKT
jgi:hypothetical protein